MKIIILILFISACSDNEIKKNYQSSNHVGRGAILTQYKANGDIEYKTYAREFQYNEKLDAYQMNSLFLWLYTSDLKPKLVASSDYGELYKNYINLMQDVNINNFQDDLLRSIKTNQLNLNFKTNTIYNQSYIQIFGYNFLETGYSIEGDLTSNYYKILNDIKFTYYE